VNPFLEPNMLLRSSLILLAVAAGAGEAAPQPSPVPGKARALWERVELGKTVMSDFAQPELPAVRDVSASQADALAAKVKALQVDAPCSLRNEKSALGDDLVILENGLVRVVILPAYGGRIIEIANKATGANVFLDNYSTAKERPAVDKKGNPPALLGGWIEAPDDGSKDYWNTAHVVKPLASGEAAVTVQTTGEVKTSSWGVAGTVTVGRVIGLERGSARVRLDISLVNHSGEQQREMRFRPQVRPAIGGDPLGDEFWLSSKGQVTHVGPEHQGDWYNALRCESGLDTWQGILDRKAREGVVVLPRGEINERMCIYAVVDKKTGQRWYTYENTSSLREHVVEGTRLDVGHDFAPVLNLDALTYADAQVAVEFLPQTLHLAPGQTVQALIGAAALDLKAVGTVTLTPVFRAQNREITRGQPLSVQADLLVARPQTVALAIPDGLPQGPGELFVEVKSKGGSGVFRQAISISPVSGTFLAVLRPADDGYGKGLSVTGTVETAQVVVESATAGRSAGHFQLVDAKIPWETRLTPLPGALRIEQVVDLSRFPAEARLQSLGLAFPLRVGTDRDVHEVAAGSLRHAWQRELVVTIGGGARDEQYLVNQSCNGYDFGPLPEIPTWALSDDAERWPIWRLGGILQLDPLTAYTWKAAGYDVPLLPVVQEKSAAGWLDVYSRLARTGVLVVMPDMAKHAPAQISFDGASGQVLIHAFPPQVPAMSLRKAGTTGRSRAEEWGVDAQGKVRLSCIVAFHQQPLCEWLARLGNKADRIRTMVASGDFTVAAPAPTPGF